MKFLHKFKPAIKANWSEVFYPLLKAGAKKTDTPWDDRAVEAMDAMITHQIEHDDDEIAIEDEPKVKDKDEE